ncbi:MAG: hypothetical protein AAFW01_09765 [Pseudomonadota bacterium]
MAGITRIRVHGSAARAVIGGRDPDDPDSIVPVVGSYLGGMIRPNFSGSVWCWVPVPIAAGVPGERVKVVGARIDFQRNFVSDRLRLGEIDLGAAEVVRDGGGPQIARIDNTQRLDPSLRSTLAGRPQGPEFVIFATSFFADGQGVPLGDHGCAVGIQFLVNPREPAQPGANIAVFSAEVTISETG